MKTKIIYISGSEIFNITDIRAAFEEIRDALQLDNNTVLFGVPVDQEDAGFGTKTEPIEASEIAEPSTPNDISEISVPEPTANEIEPIEIVESVETIIEETPEKPKTKRGRSRKAIKVEEETEEKPETVEPDIVTETIDDSVEKIVPILSVLSSEESGLADKIDQSEQSEIVENAAITEIISTESETEKSNDIITEIDEHPETENEGEPDLEKLLSAMTPLQEDISEESVVSTDVNTSDSNDDSDDVDATLEQLATEFAETQDKIAAETKSSGRGKIGKLRNILPFKQSKHKDQGLGDLFGWAGVAANDEDFSVPGFFTNVSSKK